MERTLKEGVFWPFIFPYILYVWSMVCGSVLYTTLLPLLKHGSLIGYFSLAFLICFSSSSRQDFMLISNALGEFVPGLQSVYTGLSLLDLSLVLSRC